jgi:2-haloacid dehalogenase
MNRAGSKAILTSLLCGAQAICPQSQSASPTWLRRIVQFHGATARLSTGKERMKDVKVLAFDAGGTVRDWHSGLTGAMASWGAVHHIKCDWHALANEHRHRSLRRMTNAIDPAFNIDEVHRDVLDELFDENELGGSVKERWVIAQRWHELEAWPDFAGALRRLRRRRICISFTIRSLPLIVDVSRHNGLDWDAVISYEMLRVYKTLPEAYGRAAKLLAVE